MAAGLKEDPRLLKTAPGTSEYSIYKDPQASPPALVCQVGGAADEKKPAAEGTVEAWGRSPDNPVGGRYGLRNGYRGRFGMYLPPLLGELGLAELTHDARNNQIRAIR